MQNELDSDPIILGIVEDIKADRLGGHLFYGGGNGGVRFFQAANQEFVKRGGDLTGLPPEWVGVTIARQLREWWLDIQRRGADDAS